MERVENLEEYSDTMPVGKVAYFTYQSALTQKPMMVVEDNVMY